MFGLGPATKIYIALDAVDRRKGFDGLYGLVRDHLGQDAQSGHLFLFTNRGRTRLKALVWDGSGLWVQAIGAGPLSLASGGGRRRSAQPDDAARGVVATGERLGSGAGAAAEELVSAGAGRLKTEHFSHNMF